MGGKSFNSQRVKGGVWGPGLAMVGPIRAERFTLGDQKVKRGPFKILTLGGRRKKPQRG